MKFRILNSIFFAIPLICGCGGGGSSGESIPASNSTPPSTGNSEKSTTPSIYYSQSASTVFLLYPSTVTPTLSDLDGRSPLCQLTSASNLPKGMTLNTNCTISGVPTEAGLFNSTFAFSVTGSNEKYQANLSLFVRGPLIGYDNRSLTISAQESILPTISLEGWTQPSNSSWSYRILDGSLPPGFTLDSKTGRISGIFSNLETSKTTIEVILTTDYGKYTTSTKYETNPSTPEFSYVNLSGTGQENWTDHPFIVYIGQPFSTSASTTSPTNWSEFSIVPDSSPNNSSLPAGLNLDAKTGLISGTLKLPDTYNLSGHFLISAKYTYAGASYFVKRSVSLVYRKPISYDYGGYLTKNKDISLSIVPKIIKISPLAFDGTYYFSVSTNVGAGTPPSESSTSYPSTILPEGLSINPATGEVSGTPKVVGVYYPIITIQVVSNGIIWNDYVQLHLTIK